MPASGCSNDTLASFISIVERISEEVPKQARIDMQQAERLG